MDPKRPAGGPPPGPPPEEDFSKPANASAITRRYFDSILIEERLIDAVEASLETEILGRRFSTPIMMPAFSHLKHVSDKWENGMLEYVRAAKALGMLNWVGMMENDEIRDILSFGVPTVRIIKPYADRDKILGQMAYAEEHGAVALGMDIDHIFGNDGRYDIVFGEPMTRQTMADIRSIANRLEKGEGSLGKLLSSDSTVYDDLQATIANLKTISERLEKGEGTLGKLLSSDDSLYTDLHDSVSNIKLITERLEKGEGALGQLMRDDGELTQELDGLLKDGRDLLDDLRETSPVSTFSTIFFGAL